MAKKDKKIKKGVSLFKKAGYFLKEVLLEMKRIDWPTKKESLKYTMIVIFISLVVAIFLGGIDFALITLIEKFLIK